MKDYKKILEGVVDIVNTAEKSDIGFANICSYIGENCPELKESEDERIRGNIIATIHLYYGEPLEDEAKEMLAWLEKQGEQKLPIEKLPFEMKTVSESLGFTSKKECDDYNKMVTNLIMSDDKGKQKPADKVSLNFEKGDILYEQKTMNILLVYERNGSWLMTFCNYWMLKEKLHVEFPYENYGFVREMSLVPATKEQRDLLFQKMHEAGYEWDDEKKELKKIEQKPAMIQWKGNNLKEVIDFTGIYKDGFKKWFHNSWEEYEKYVHEHNNIFKIFNKDGSHIEVPVGAWIVKTPDGYNTASRYVFRQKPAVWSEEDENNISDLCSFVVESYRPEDASSLITWLKSLKDRVQPQSKQEWSEEDEKMLKAVIEDIHCGTDFNAEVMHEANKREAWLKSLRPQSQWKPSEKQMKALKNAIDGEWMSMSIDTLESLYNDLKKLKE